MKKAILLAAIAAVGITSINANAAVITISTDGIQAYNNTTNFTPVPFDPSLNPATKGVVYEIPVNFQLSGLTPTQSFGLIQVNVSYNGSVVPDLNGGPYSASTQAYTFGKGTVAYYFANGDSGSSTTDLQNIAGAFPSGPATSARATAGIGSPFNLGYVYFQLPSGATENGTVTITATQYGLNDNGTLVVQSNDGIVQAPAITFAVPAVPEPATISLLGLGGLALAARRRRHA